MGVNVIRKDSVKERRKEKTRKQLQEENEQLQAQVEMLGVQVEEQADALLELAALMTGEEG